MVHLQKDSSGKFRQQITIGNNKMYADLGVNLGGDDSAPGPHDLFDSSLAACKAITLMMYAQRKGIPLESVNVDIDRDDSKEKLGEYTLNVSLQFLGDLTDEQKKLLLTVAEKCPVHKLMTQTTIHVNTSLSPI
jgi:putative redox protein